MLGNLLTHLLPIIDKKAYSKNQKILPTALAAVVLVVQVSMVGFFDE